MENKDRNSDIFREKSLKRVSSPDELDKYIKSTNASVWVILSALFLIIIGVIVWASFGKIESSATVGCRVELGISYSYIKETDREKLCDESNVTVNDTAYKISDVQGPFLADEESDGFLLQAAGIENGDWYYILSYGADLDDGEYKAKTVFEKVTPITFIIN